MLLCHDKQKHPGCKIVTTQPACNQKLEVTYTKDVSNYVHT